ncbi:MAG TPA: D-alanyl-D-alanine carboxypeptidase/D-alanyl-D-alanine-endopeptidase [Amnibacterium sp.]|jgi:D-alanyl-D-alanine carboxypeptidase/D-alanyl-D-alanine-endopeptidase (penicillin-binding protein 4)
MRRRTTAIVGGATLVALVAGCWGAAHAMGGAQPATTVAARPAAAVATSAAAPTPAITPTATATPKPKPTVQAVARTCSIAAAARDPRLLHFQGAVLDVKTGKQLFGRGADTPSRTASVLKVLTTAAALHVLGPGYRLTTKVVAGSAPGEIVLVGGGDVTLSRTPAGSTPYYAGAPHLSDLARQVKKAWAADPAHKGVKITRIVLDSSYFGGPSWQPSWAVAERIDGTTPKMTALMVDGDRDNPYATVSHRSTDPVGRAGSVFAGYFGSVKVTRGTAPAGARVLGAVHSQPVSTLVKQTLIVSDNTLAETLARVTAIVSGAGNTFSAEQAGTLGGLQAYGVDTTGIRIVDGSGLSDDNRVAPRYLTKLMVKVLHRDGALGALYDGLPIAGRTGSLSYSDRFQGAAARADGQVHAKTGWIDTGYTLSGIIHAKDGTMLTFAFYALGSISESTKYALDGITADTWACGAKLSNG